MLDPAVHETRHERRLSSLDGLRALAIASVAYYHIWLVTWFSPQGFVFGHYVDLIAFPSAGALGVDLFFFVSGFCLFHPYVQSLFGARPKQTLAQFAWRRLVKIVPSYLLFMVVLVSLGVASDVKTPVDGIREIAIHLTFLHPWFPSSFGSIAGVLWSLGVEVEFYVMFPLICWAALRRPWLVFAFMFAEALGFRLLFATDGYTIGYRINQVFAVLDLFGGGMLAAYLCGWLPRRFPAIAKRRIAWTVAATLGLCAIAWTYVDCYSWSHLQNWDLLWRIEHRTLLAAILVVTTVAALFAFPWWQRAFGNRVLIFISTISYNLYLWHQVVSQQLARLRIPNPATPDGHDDPAWRMLAFVVDIAASIAVASLVTFAFERPLLKIPLPAFSRRATAAVRSRPTL